jgi:hypothetical protein
VLQPWDYEKWDFDALAMVREHMYVDVQEPYVHWRRAQRGGFGPPSPPTHDQPPTCDMSVGGLRRGDRCGRFLGDAVIDVKAEQVGALRKTSENDWQRSHNEAIMMSAALAAGADTTLAANLRERLSAAAENMTLAKGLFLSMPTSEKHAAALEEIVDSRGRRWHDGWRTRMALAEAQYEDWYVPADDLKREHAHQCFVRGCAGQAYAELEEDHSVVRGWRLQPHFVAHPQCNLYEDVLAAFQAARSLALVPATDAKQLYVALLRQLYSAVGHAIRLAGVMRPLHALRIARATDRNIAHYRTMCTVPIHAVVWFIIVILWALRLDHPAAFLAGFDPDVADARDWLRSIAVPYSWMLTALAMWVVSTVWIESHTATAWRELIVRHPLDDPSPGAVRCRAVGMWLGECSAKLLMLLTIWAAVIAPLAWCGFDSSWLSFGSAVWPLTVAVALEWGVMFFLVFLRLQFCYANHRQRERSPLRALGGHGDESFDDFWLAFRVKLIVESLILFHLLLIALQLTGVFRISWFSIFFIPMFGLAIVMPAWFIFNARCRKNVCEFAGSELPPCLDSSCSRAFLISLYFVVFPFTLAMFATKLDAPDAADTALSHHIGYLPLSTP